MQRWEYARVVRLTDSERQWKLRLFRSRDGDGETADEGTYSWITAVHRVLEDLGREGWELAGYEEAESDGSIAVYWLKRPAD